LETRIAERTWELETSNGRLVQSEELRKLALAAGQMGTWNWEAMWGLLTWDEGQYRIFGVDPGDFAVTIESVRALVDPVAGDKRLDLSIDRAAKDGKFWSQAVSIHLGMRI
jgi:hypothetical protein